MQPFYLGLLLKYYFTSFTPAMWPENNCLEKVGLIFFFPKERVLLLKEW